MLELPLLTGPAQDLQADAVRTQSDITSSSKYDCRTWRVWLCRAMLRDILRRVVQSVTMARWKLRRRWGLHRHLSGKTLHFFCSFFLSAVHIQKIARHT